MKIPVVCQKDRGISIQNGPRDQMAAGRFSFARLFSQGFDLLNSLLATAPDRFPECLNILRQCVKLFQWIFGVV
jgi:hypothetical protein